VDALAKRGRIFLAASYSIMALKAGPYIYAYKVSAVDCCDSNLRGHAMLHLRFGFRFSGNVHMSFLAFFFS